MPFVSYAQNSEDVVLWRALRDIGTGFYVDVGAGDPKEDSVTYAFYERGWSGINIEPSDEFFARLAQNRPRDTNLKVAVGREVGPRTFYTIEGTGLSTLHPEIAARHKSAGFAFSETTVPVMTLERILEDFSARTIHFLKIDAEGAEAEVLQGIDLTTARPWIILVEATEPNSPVVDRGAWEHLITSQGYSFCYFDGLNCFYVSDERSQLKERIAVPPNVFDDFVRVADWSNRQKAATLECELANLKEDIRELEEAFKAEQRQSAALYDDLQAEQLQTAKLRDALQTEQMHTISVQQATINHLIGRTRELEANLAALPHYRGVLGGLRKIGDQVTGGGARSLARRVLPALLVRAKRHPALMALGQGALKPFPKLREELNRLVTTTQGVADQSISSSTGPRPPGNFTGPASLTASEQRIYLRLRTAVSEGSARKSNQ
jgi:FkbM family methyltransferase